MSEVDKQLKKGVIEIIVLKVLSSRDMYGYQIIQELDEKSKGMFRMKEGTLYPILYRLEDNKYIESYWEPAAEKRSVPRKYYRITDYGRRELRGMLDEWKSFISGVNSILSEV
ncbi:MAG: PadR family transcriptional regulator [Bacillota bacterium]